MRTDNVAWVVTKVVSRALRNAVQARLGRFRSWPDDGLLLSEPLALAEERTDRLRRIYANAGRDLWDGPTLFREAMEKHGGIQLPPEKRAALAHPVAGLMWGELAAWIARGGRPRGLPDDAAFGGSERDLVVTYELAWVAAQLVADRWSEQALVDLYREVDRRVDAGYGQEAVDGAFRVPAVGS